MSQSNVLVGKTAVFQHVRLKAASPLTTLPGRSAPNLLFKIPEWQLSRLCPQCRQFASNPLDRTFAAPAASRNRFKISGNLVANDADRLLMIRT